MKKYYLLSLFVTAMTIISCENNEYNTPTDTVEFRNRSITPSFVKMGPDFSGVEIYPLVSSEDIIPDSNNMVYGGAPDGQGFIKNPTGHGYIMVTNHENTWAVSRLYLDKKLNIYKDSITQPC